MTTPTKGSAFTFRALTKKFGDYTLKSFYMALYDELYPLGIPFINCDVVLFMRHVKTEVYNRVGSIYKSQTITEIPVQCLDVSVSLDSDEALYMLSSNQVKSVQLLDKHFSSGLGMQCHACIPGDYPFYIGLPFDGRRVVKYSMLCELNSSKYFTCTKFVDEPASPFRVETDGITFEEPLVV